MKVNIYETVEVSDEDRKLVAAVLGQKVASREDLKAFIWQRGSDWRASLHPAVDDGAKVEEWEYAAPVTDEDLIGGDGPTDQAKYDAALAAAHEKAREALLAENEDLL